MIVLDTNVVVRLVVNDDARQVAIARRLLQREVVLLTTVILETEWVLRKTYMLPREQVIASISTLCGLGSVTVSEPEVIENALGLHAKGMDFADAVHLRRSVELKADAFVTFDKSLRVKAAKLVDGLVVREP